jgi:hypothetical protein
MPHDTELLNIPATDIKIGDTLLVAHGTAYPNPRVVLLIADDSSAWGPDILPVQQDSCITYTLLLKDEDITVRRPVTEAGKKAVFAQLLISWRDAHYCAEFGGRDYTATSECKTLTEAMFILEHGVNAGALAYEDYLMDILDRAYEGTGEHYFIIPN